MRTVPRCHRRWSEAREAWVLVWPDECVAVVVGQPGLLWVATV